MRLTFLTAVPLLVTLVAPPAAAEQTGVIMRDVYDAIAYLLPRSLRGPDDGSAWDSELIEQKLDVLSAASGALVAHAGEEDVEFRLLARSFDRMVQDATTAFREQWPDYAYYSLMELTDHCVSCHSRLPADSQVLFGQRLMARMDADDLTPRAKAALYVATRQFDAALGVLERHLLDPALDPIEAEYRGLMIPYLRTAISVDGAWPRVRRFLAAYGERDDLPHFLARRLQYWDAALARHAPTLAEPATLEGGFAAFDAATAATLAPGNRLRAVDDFVAARLLRAWLRAYPEAAAADRAEAFYRLAIIALRTNEPEPAVPEMEMLLVACIEAEPGTERARTAYALLEEYGYVHEEHLARQLESRMVIDMAALRQAAGLAE